MTDIIFKDNKLKCLLLLLFFITPFIQSDTSDVSQPLYLNNIPPIFSVVSNLIRWIIFLSILFHGFLNLTKVFERSSKINFLYSVFYLPLLLYSIVSNEDQIRYIALLLLSFFISSYYSFFFNDRLLKKMFYCVVIFVLLSFYVSGMSVFYGLRFQGMLGNSNMYGISACFWFCVMLLYERKYGTSYLLLLIKLLLIYSVVISGSRSGLVVLIIVFLSSINKNNVLVYTSFILILSILFLFISNSQSYSFIFERFQDISNSASDSGRLEIWQRAFSYIRFNYQGFGMNSPSIMLGTGNVHNCYVRFVFTIGLPLSIITMIIYSLLLFSIIFYFHDYEIRICFAFLIGLLLANFGEDFFVGIGSGIFIYHSIIIGYICKRISILKRSNRYYC